MGTDLLMVRILTDLANGEPLSVFAIVLNGLRINQLLNVIPTEETDVSSLEEHYSILVKLDVKSYPPPSRKIGTAITVTLRNHCLYSTTTANKGLF